MSNVNLTIRKLTTYSLLLAPYHSPPKALNYKETTFYNIRINNFFSSFYYGSSSLSIKNSYFSNILNSSIVQDSSNIISERSEFPLILTTIENTFFYNIKTTKYGAAISSFGSLHITNCRFSELYAENTGAVQVFGECLLKQCSFSDIGANDKVAVLEQISPKDPIDLDVNFTNTLKTSAKYFGGFFRISRGVHRTFNSNFSYSIVRECVGFSELKYGSIITKDTLFYKIRAKVHNGCNIYKECLDCTFDNTNFIDVEQHSYISDTATSVVINQPLNEISFSKCVFLDLSPEEQTIFSESQEKMIFTDCRFKKDQSLSLKIINPVLVNTNFSDKSPLKITKDIRIGYHRNLNLWSFIPKFTFSWKVFFYSFIFSLATACLLTFLHLRFSKARHQHKAIKAFL